MQQQSMRLASPDRMRQLMNVNDLSIRDLATACGLRSHTMIHQLLNGTRTSCSPALAASIAAQLGVSKVEMLFVPKTEDL